MSNRPFIVFAIFAAICLIAIPIYALGKEGGEGAAPVDVAAEDGDAAKLFDNNCGTCHTLAAAGTDGIVGPNLDEILTTGGSNTADQYESVYGRVLLAVGCGLEGRMPKGILVGEEAKDVSAFVAAYAAQIGKGPTVELASAKKAEAEPCQSAAASAEAQSE